MRKEHIEYLVCPECGSELAFEDPKVTGNSVESGFLKCAACGKKFEIRNHIPRFVDLKNYADSFALEWTVHSRTQYDSYSGSDISQTRFFNETLWPRNMEGQVILEVGSGSGRFTEQAVSTGAMVVSMDLSGAVDANYASNGANENALIVQADIYKMPFRKSFFDKLFCFGVLQHTPDIEKAFLALPHYLKDNGKIVIDVYAKEPGVKGLIERIFMTRYWIRPMTRNMPPDRLYKLCRRYVSFMWPIARVIGRIPRIGTSINWHLLIADYRGAFRLSDEMLKEWAILDTFDMLSPRYEFPQYIDTVKRWFRDAALREINVKYGYNGIEGHGTK